MAETNNVPEIKLTLDPFGEKIEQEAETAIADSEAIKANAGKLTEFAKANLTPEEQKTVADTVIKLLKA